MENTIEKIQEKQIWPVVLLGSVHERLRANAVAEYRKAIAYRALSMEPLGVVAVPATALAGVRYDLV
jgi:hypothetical protein